jgi:hypothetical protein
MKRRSGVAEGRPSIAPDHRERSEGEGKATRTGQKDGDMTETPLNIA